MAFFKWHGQSLVPGSLYPGVASGYLPKLSPKLHGVTRQPSALRLSPMHRKWAQIKLPGKEQVAGLAELAEFKIKDENTPFLREES